MRYQEPIYIQNKNSGVRNRAFINVNMSSDICIFTAPLVVMSGASKIQCLEPTLNTSYVISGNTTAIPLTFAFIANVDSFSATSATFKYEIYKFNPNVDVFTTPAVYKSSQISYSAFSATNEVINYIPIDTLKLDGEYLIKPYYNFKACTNYLNKLGKTVDTLAYMSGSEYGLYDEVTDWYFIAFKAADIPQFTNNGKNTMAASRLFQQILPAQDGQTVFVISNNYVGYPIITLNGLVLSPTLDYTLSGNVVTLNAEALSTDILTAIYTTYAGFSLIGDTISITGPIMSGATDMEGANTAYYNTTTGKYEVYTSVEPSNIGNILVMINGLTLANGLDYYQSITNTKRIILEGPIMLGDIVTIVYIPSTDLINGLITSHPVVSWTIDNSPQLVNGVFTLQVSTGNTFSTLYSSSSQPYVVGKVQYSDTFLASGSTGTTLYYRVKNEKDYVTLCNNVIGSIAYSETLPVIIQSNSINSY